MMKKWKKKKKSPDHDHDHEYRNVCAWRKGSISVGGTRRRQRWWQRPHQQQWQPNDGGGNAKRFPLIISTARWFGYGTERAIFRNFFYLI